MSATAIINDFDAGYNTVNPYTLLEDILKSDEKPEKTSNGDSSEINAMLFKAQPSQIREYRENTFILSNLKARIKGLALHELWIQEEVEEPNYVCREKAYEVAEFLYKRFEYYPERIGPSKEGGIFIYYINYLNNKTLSVEVSNDLEIAALINKDKEILGAVDIFNFDFSEIIPVYAA